MGKSRLSVIVLGVLGLVAVASIAGQFLIVWEWWDLMVILSTMAFGVGLVLTVLQSVFLPHD